MSDPIIAANLPDFLAAMEAARTAYRDLTWSDCSCGSRLVGPLLRMKVRFIGLGIPSNGRAPELSLSIPRGGETPLIEITPGLIRDLESRGARFNDSENRLRWRTEEIDRPLLVVETKQGAEVPDYLRDFGAKHHVELRHVPSGVSYKGQPDVVVGYWGAGNPSMEEELLQLPIPPEQLVYGQYDRPYPG